MTEAEKKDVVTIDSEVVQDKESEQLKEAVEQSEALMKFPMEFPIKVMGDASPSFPRNHWDYEITLRRLRRKKRCRHLVENPQISVRDDNGYSEIERTA